MIDIHSHIAPAVDDGSRSLEETLELMRMESSGGTTVMFATPHVYGGSDFEMIQRLGGIVDELNEALEAEDLGIRAVAGAEVFPSPEIGKSIAAGMPLFLGPSQKYILLDLPFGNFPPYLSDLVFDLRVRKITPILAHPERTTPVQQSLAVLDALLEQGAVCQVNAGSLRGRYGPHAQACGETILKHHWAHFIASDAHRPGKTPGMGSAREAVASMLNEEYVEVLTRLSGEAVLAGDPLPELFRLPIVPETKRGWFGSLFHKKSKD